MRLVILLLVLSAPVQGDEPLMIATGDFLPYTSMQSANGGFLTELTMRAFELAELEANDIYLPWARGFLGVKSLQYDATFPYVKTPQREKDFLYSDPLFPIQLSIFVRQGETHLFNYPEDFTGHSWCLPRGYATGDLAPYLEQGLMTLIRASDSLACLKMLAKGRVSAVPLDIFIAEKLTKGEETLFSQITRLPWALSEYHFYLLVSKTHPRGQEILRGFNRGLKLLRDSGEWQQILQLNGISSGARPPD